MVDGGKSSYIGKWSIWANRAIWGSGRYGQIELYRQAVDMGKSSYVSKWSMEADGGKSSYVGKWSMEANGAI